MLIRKTTMNISKEIREMMGPRIIIVNPLQTPQNRAMPATAVCFFMNCSAAGFIGKPPPGASSSSFPPRPPLSMSPKS